VSCVVDMPACKDVNTEAGNFAVSVVRRRSSDSRLIGGSEVGEVASRTWPQPFTAGSFLVLISVRG
jgi:hypothetical protein